MSSRYSIETIYKVIDQMTKPFSKMSKASKGFHKQLKADFAKAQRSAMDFNRNFVNNMKTGIRVGIGVAIAGLGLLAKKGIELASSLTEVQNVVDTTFEGSSKIIDKWSKTAITQYGLSELQAKQFSSTIGAMIKPSGIAGDQLANMSKDIASLSGDIASFRDLEPDEVFEKLQSIVTGTVKPLTSIGIVMTVANLEAFALSKGITKSWKSMTQAEKVMLRYNFVLERTKDMQGDYNKTLKTSFANQMRTLRIKFFDKLSRAMIKLIPLLIKGAEFLSGFLDKIDENKLADQIVKGATAVINFTKGLYKLFKIVKPFIPLILSLVAGVALYNKAMFIAAQLSLLMKVRMNPLILAIGILVFIIYKIIKNWDKLNTVQKIIIVTLGVLATSIIGLMVVRKVMMLVKGWTIAQWALNVALNANPIGAVILAITAMIAVIVLCIIYYKEIIAFTRKWWDILKGLLLPLGGLVTILLMWVEAIRSVISHWDMVKEAFKSDGIIGGILAIGKAIVAGVLSPIQSLLMLLGKIPGVGKMFKEWGVNIGEMKGGLVGETQAPVTPEERAARITEEKTEKAQLDITDNTGKAKLTTPKSNLYNINLKKSGAF